MSGLKQLQSFAGTVNLHSQTFIIHFTYCIMLLWLIATIVVGGTCALNTHHTRNAYGNRYRPSPDRQNYFDAELLEVFVREKEGNVVISPLSIKLGLGMIMLGSSGSSANEIQASLRLSKEEARTLFQEKLSSVKGSSTNDLQIASQIFVSADLRTNQTYQKSLMETFGSGVTPISFRNPAAAHNILNKWVTDATYGLISKISERGQISPNTKLIVANAVYFKGKWQNQFSKLKTKRKCFYAYNDQCVYVSMMSESGEFDYGYVPKLDAYAINLPYEGKRYSMLLILPRDNYGHRQLGLDLLHVSLDEVMSQLQPQEVYVEIPRFTIKTDKDLIPILMQLRIIKIFGPQANISNIFENPSGPLSVDKVFHSAKIIVDEEGVESAAVAANFFIPLMGGSATSFKADHPFLFFIRDTVTGTVLFSGKIELPEEEEVHETQSQQQLNDKIDDRDYSVRARMDSDRPGSLGGFSGNSPSIPKPTSRISSAGQQTVSQATFPAGSSLTQGRYPEYGNNNGRPSTDSLEFRQVYSQWPVSTTNYNPYYARMFFRS